ncbi:hypothetical protein BWQ96_10201 [Gracilariopsis chorda]|uniref:BZIP domain-containing protein n=1 Tax=Gracilariopsis chorda TaxID=448386 RepID=A0A2V3IDE8_9FLOR|nr:hypothetical protein BWQ96_10201 [Gracilariopsis chorda]|eukprot:PXF40103.1 hypothetical protein BWQ96_10201 [Gracilariopsis chorda]
MSTAQLLLPTAEDVQALAALALNPEVTPCEALLSLQGVLDFISDSDIFKFLFTEDPVHIPHIAMPDLSSKSIAGNFTKTRVEPGNTTVDSLSCHASGSYILVPAFTVNHTTYGFGIHMFVDTSANRTPTSPPSPLFHTAESRFVKNESSGILLKVLDSDQSGFITVEYSCMSSYTRILRSAATFYRNKFRSVLRSGRLDMPRVLSCISEFQTANQYRRCPICTRGHRSCHCTLRATEPRHPFDTIAFLKNMSMRFGKFEGVGGVTSYVNGKDRRKALLGCRYIVDGKLNLSKVEQMRSLVIEKHLNKANPLNFFVSPDMSDQLPTSSTFAPTDTRAPSDILSELLLKEDEKKVSMALENHDHALYLWDGNQTCSDHSSPPTLTQQSFFPMANDLSLLIPSTQPYTSTAMQHSQLQTSSTGFDQVDSLVSTPNNNDTDGINTTTSNPDELLRLQKLEKRKARNRASAMRSHLKKKAFIDSLKQELHRNHDSILHLRSREMMLRKENLRLRKLLSGE